MRKTLCLLFLFLVIGSNNFGFAQNSVFNLIENKMNPEEVKEVQSSSKTDSAGKLKLGEFMNKVEESKEKIKEKEEEVLKVKKEAEQIKFEKEALEKEVLTKEQDAIIAVQELEAIKKEAQTKKDPKAKEKIKEISTQAAQLKSEADLLKDKLSISEVKAKAAEEKVTIQENAVQQAKGHMESLWHDRIVNRSLPRKLFISLIIILIGLFIFYILKYVLRIFQKVITPKDVLRESEKTLRLKTFGKLMDWLSGLMIFGIVVYAILGNFGVDASFLIAGAGIVGIAFGFGGQYLIRDIISGLFILLEGQYRLNDVVKIGDDAGLVEDINLRITTLRDLEGRVIIIPNGEINRVINYTKGYAHALFNVGIAYKENVDNVMAVIKQVGKELKEDVYFKRLILADLEMFGVDDFADSQVTIKFRIKTIPIKQWEVAREFRRRLKNRFDELGIEIPFPHRTLYLGAGKDNEWLRSYAEVNNKQGE